MADKSGMALADADENILKEYDFEEFKKDMERLDHIICGKLTNEEICTRCLEHKKEIADAFQKAKGE